MSVIFIYFYKINNFFLICCDATFVRARERAKSFDLGLLALAFRRQ
jgi:hypothetical protein